MRMIVCGGRHFNDPAYLWRQLDRLSADRGGIRCVIDGASDDVTGPYVGADYWGHQWALARLIPYERFHADWKTLGRAAGPIRNKRMRDEAKPDFVAAFSGGKGTRSMIDLALEGGIEVIQL